MVARREFFVVIPAAAVSLAVDQRANADRTAPRPSLAGKFGVTTGSFVRHLSQVAAPKKLVLLDLPQIMRDELGMDVLDLMTATLPSLEPDYCERLRAAAEKAGCTVTNLKLNQPNLNLASPEPEQRRHALQVYKRSIDAAATLGCRWVRPLPSQTAPDLKLLAAGYRELIDYAAPKGISLLVENYGWMKNDPSAIPQIIRAVGDGIAAQPDTGNWTAKARDEGLRLAFPHAVSCDFKAFQLGPNGEHKDYDLRRCFEIAWRAGFRGPWCFEHFHDDLAALWRELKLLKTMLQSWTHENAAK